MPSTMVVLPIVSALWSLVSFNGGNSIDNLYPINKEQKAFIEKYASKRDDLSHFDKKELRAWASDSIPFLNKVLKDEGFSIQLKERPPQDMQVGFVSILDVMVKWLHEGSKTVLKAVDENKYSAVAMNKGFKMHTASVHDHPIISILTQNNDKVCMTVADGKYESFELLDRIEQIRKAAKKKAKQFYDELIFPMVDYDKEVSISWLIGLESDDRKFNQKRVVDQALQQTKFKMNEKGARVKSAVAMSTILESCARFDKSTYTVDKPFLIWIERPGVDAPVFTGYMDYNQWKDPKNLEL